MSFSQITLNNRNFLQYLLQDGKQAISMTEFVNSMTDYNQEAQKHPDWKPIAIIDSRTGLEATTSGSQWYNYIQPKDEIEDTFYSLSDTQVIARNGVQSLIFDSAISDRLNKLKQSG